MKICVFGAGAIGGLLGVRLAKAGADVTFVARGPHLEAMKANGVKLISGGEETVVHPRCTGNAAEAGPQDYVIVTLKAHSLPGAADQMQPLLGPETAVVAAINGVPWWYFYQLPGPYTDRRVQSVDPGGKLWEKLHPRRAIGCIVYPAAEVVAPGVIEHTYGDRFVLGEPDGSKSERIQALSQLMMRAGFKSPVRPRIRDEIWVKLWGNLAFNPLSALTGGTLAELCRDAATRGVARSMMVEAQAVGERLGVAFPITVDKRIDGAAEVGEHKTSMLQDLERGRPLEIDALLGAPVEMARLVELPSPICDTVLALVRQRARLAGCYPG
ncbi:MAG TPA: 2-dehydropantoate 2-reductase [Stellaceae bacterium]|nr:2-dehydropantoate 2-reductase [Stellaceae bacterium]